MEEQYSSAEETQTSVKEYRVGTNLEKELEDDVREIVHHSLEKAVADEIFEKVKSEKIATETPVVEPKFGARASAKLGIRFIIMEELSV